MNEFLPSEFYLGQNYPNPFKEKTTIKYCIPYKTKVRITVFNSEGEMLAKLVDEEKNIGTHKIEFCAVLVNRHLKSGIYFYQLKAGDYLSEKEMRVL